MKHLKKIMSLLLTAIMVIAMCVPVMAEVDLSGHTFEAYQIFTGTYDADAGNLSNIGWGDNVDNERLLKESTLTGCESASDVADKLTDKTIKVQEFADMVANYLTGNPTTGTGTINLPAAGYYLIKDTTDVTGKDDAKNFTLLKVNAAGSVTPTVKTDKPSFEKKVKDTNDTTGETTEWQDSADYDIGDIIPYQLTATMGDLSAYNTYYVKFHDTMTHLTYGGITSVKVGETVLNGTEYAVGWDSTKKELTVTIKDVKKYNAEKGTKVVVEYTATLDSDAVIGSEGNPNTAYLEYSNNPNNSGAGETGKTPEDKNIVFTYKVTANKIDKDKEKLKGAAFELLKKNSTGNYQSVGIQNATRNDDGTYTLTDKDKTSFEWKGLDDGDYRIVEVVTPSGYNTINPIDFTVTAEHETLSDNPQLTSLSGGDKFTGTVETGDLTTDIINLKGSELPETGGIGTTIFYVVGVVLMLGAGVLLITKRRMSAKH